MSTEQQQYSLDNQSEVIRRYAEERNMTVVRTYSDAGKTGLTLAERAGLKQLITMSSEVHPDFPWCWFTTSAAGADFRTRMKAPIMNIVAAGRRCQFTIVRRASPMTGALLQPSSRQSNARWQRNTADALHDPGHDHESKVRRHQRLQSKVRQVADPPILESTRDVDQTGQRLPCNRRFGIV